MLLVPVYTKVQSPLNWEVPGCCHLLGRALWQKYFWAEYILWRLSIICSRQKKLNEMWMSRNVFNNNWLLLLVSEHRKCFVGNFGSSNDWAQVDRWQPLNGIFFLLPMKYFSRVILGNHQSSDLCTLSLSRAQQIFDLPRCSESRNTWGNSNSFLLRCCWKLLYFKRRQPARKMSNWYPCWCL